MISYVALIADIISSKYKWNCAILTYIDMIQIFKQSEDKYNT